MKRIEVVAAIIIDNDGKILATRRGYGDMAGLWEFPGGKIEKGESPEDALKREIREELNVDIEVEKFITTVDYDYPVFHLTMHCYQCRLTGENDSPTLLEHTAARRLNRDKTLPAAVDWLPADLLVVEKLI